MEQYLSLLSELVGKADSSELRQDRTSTGCYSVFGKQSTYDLSQGFPLVTTKRVFWKGVVGELLWFLSGSTSVKPLVEQGINIWNDWADFTGELGPVYGKQWRNWNDSVDQIARLETALRNKPMSRRHLVLSFNPGDLPEVAPPGCHSLFQLFVEGEHMHMHMYQRSADIMLGVPFNIACYALLLSMFARTLDLTPGNLTISYGDLHLYSNHVEGAKKQLSRTPSGDVPYIRLTKRESVLDYTASDIELHNYKPQGRIKLPVAV